MVMCCFLFFFQAEDGIRDRNVTGVQTCALPIFDLDLISFGVGEIVLPAEIAPRVKDLGFLPQEEVGDAYAAAAAYIQPSLFESFSRTIMESWLAGTPVIANSACEVVRWHCERSS